MPLIRKERTMPKLKKINNDGTYGPYPGVTVVARAKTEDSEFWQKVNQLITSNKRLNRYYTPFPYTCYHMTAINLFTENAVGSDNWKDFLDANQGYLSSLHKALEKEEFVTEIIPKGIHVSGSVSIIVQLPKEQQKIIRDIAERYGVSSNMPAAFHMTLGYQYKAIPNREVNAIQQELHDSFIDLVNEYGKQLLLQPPKLCSFESMVSGYEDWDGLTFPFEKPEPIPEPKSPRSSPKAEPPLTPKSEPKTPRSGATTPRSGSGKSRSDSDSETESPKPRLKTSKPVEKVSKETKEEVKEKRKEIKHSRRESEQQLEESREKQVKSKKKTKSSCFGFFSKKSSDDSDDEQQEKARPSRNRKR